MDAALSFIFHSTYFHIKYVHIILLKHIIKQN